MKILLTGATGFIGRSVYSEATKIRGWELAVIVRRNLHDESFQGSHVVCSEIDESFRWPTTLSNIDCVIHCAGRAHVMNDVEEDPLAEFRRVNLGGTMALARGAAEAGVKRFVFISSIGVNGQVTRSGAFVEEDPPSPEADYALSKLEAEQQLVAFQMETSMEIVIIRPPLVYASNAPGNFQRLLQLVSSRVPLPLRGVNNLRSMIALESLVNFILCCVEHPAAANQIFLIADREALSTEEIVRQLALGMGSSTALLFPYPDWLIRLAARVGGKQGIYSQLYGSLQVDASKARRLLGWQPRLSAQAALQKAGREYKHASQASLVKPATAPH